MLSRKERLSAKKIKQFISELLMFAAGPLIFARPSIRATRSAARTEFTPRTTHRMEKMSLAGVSVGI